MEFFDAVCKRASVREYKDSPVDNALIEKLVDAGRRAPTARAVEPWEFIPVRDRATLQRLGKAVAQNAPFMENAPACVAIYCKDTKYYLEDGCAATQNILLAAHACGLGGCWIAGDKKPYCEEVKRILAAPAAYKLVSIVSLGYPQEETAVHDKRDVDEVLHWECF